jgi:hypothetical protein
LRAAVPATIMREDWCGVARTTDPIDVRAEPAVLHKLDGAERMNAAGLKSDSGQGYLAEQVRSYGA